MCYKQSPECWGGEWPVVVNGNLESACTAHKGGKTKTPVIEIFEVDSVLDDYDELELYLTPFLKEEVGDVPGSMIYGAGSPFADMAAGIYAYKHKLKKIKPGPEPTHLFIAWDFEDQETWDRLDALLAKDVVVQSVVV